MRFQTVEKGVESLNKFVKRWTVICEWVVDYLIINCRVSFKRRGHCFFSCRSVHTIFVPSPQKWQINILIESAVKEAEKRRHEYVTIEHILLALIKNQDIGTILHDFKIPIGQMIREVETYLDTKCSDIVSKSGKPVAPRKTASLERLMNRAFTQALFQGRQDVTATDILISIFAEKKSYASYFLKKFKVDKQDLMDLVSTETILDEGMAALGGGQPGPEQKLRPNQADRILKSYCENLNQKYFDKKIDPVIRKNPENIANATTNKDNSKNMMSTFFVWNIHSI